MSEDMVRDLPVEEAPQVVGGVFNMADIVVFVIFVGSLLVFYIYKKYQESQTITIKPVSLQ